MGVVNVTPDSFSDGGRFLDEAAAVAHARKLMGDGADILDIGGESTRPGAELVSEAEELARVIPVIERLWMETAGRIQISVDTTKPGVARAAMEAGAIQWNDVTALRGDPDSLSTAAELQCAVVLMHMQGDPRTMQESPRYDDVVGEVEAFLHDRAEAAKAAGVSRAAIALDPGIGFGKTPEHNLALLRALPRLRARLGHPILIGASRKRFIRALDPSAQSADDRLGGSLATALWAAQHGVAVIRVHDVRETVQALAVQAAILQAAA